MNQRWFVDTSVFLLGAGGPHPGRQGAISFLRRAATDAAQLHASVEALQEFTFHRLRRVDREQALQEAEELAQVLHVHTFDAEVMADALTLMRSTEVRGRDAVHAATALRSGFTQIVSADRDFDSVPGLTRLSPANAV